MNGLVVCFAGGIGSGKSSVTSSLAQILHWPRSGFGDYLRAEILRRGGDPDSRGSLQDLGQSLVEKDPAAFCRAVMDVGGISAGGSGLVDGIRHVEILAVVERITRPSATRLIFLSAEKVDRLSRLSARSGGAQDFVRADGHKVESALATDIPRRADKIVDASQRFDDVVNECLNEIHEWKLLLARDGNPI
jgi:dephospho-CoA kinase